MIQRSFWSVSSLLVAVAFCHCGIPNYSFIIKVPDWGHLQLDYKPPREDTISERQFPHEDICVLFVMPHTDLSLNFPLHEWKKKNQENNQKGLRPSWHLSEIIFPFCKEIKASIILSLLLWCKVCFCVNCALSKKELACDERDSCSFWRFLIKSFSSIFMPHLNVLCQKKTSPFLWEIMTVCFLDIT